MSTNKFWSLEFLKKKWSYWFKTMDVNHDGLITRADVDQSLKDYPNVKGLSEKVGKLANDKIERWWNTYFLKGRDTVTEEDFIVDLERQYMEDKDKFITTNLSCVDDIINVIDPDHTNIITVDNYVKNFIAFGHNNEESLRKAFEMYKPVNGMISVEEFRNDWMIFVTNEDPSKPDVVFDAYKQDLLL